MDPIVVNNLSFSYDGGPPVLREISFTVREGEMLVIAGESGSGKTTLCRILCGIIPHAIKGDVSGEAKVMDIYPSSAGITQTAQRVGMSFQDADSQIICTTVEDELAFGLENLNKPRTEIRRRVDELMYEYGFDDCHENPARLSDGRKKLLTIAAALAASPPVLLLDEPLNGLDSDARELIISTIERQKRQGQTIVIVEHDLKATDFADRWLLLHNGSIALSGDPAELLKDERRLVDLGVWA